MSSNKYLKLGKYRVRTHNLLVFLYSAVVSFALVLVICKNFQTPEEILEEEKKTEQNLIEKQELEAANVSVPEVYTAEVQEEPVEDENWQVSGEESEPVLKHDIIEVKRGDNFINLLQDLGLEYKEAYNASQSLKKAGFDVRHLKVGQDIEVSKLVDSPFGELISVEKIVIEPTIGTKYVLTKDDEDNFTTEIEQAEFETDTQLASGVIDSSLAVAMKNAGVPQSIIGNFINIFVYTVDFRSEIKVGNKFRVMYDRKVDSEGRVVKNGDIQFAELDLGRNGKITLYRYKDSHGGVDYYNKNGTVLKRSLDKKPLEFRSARISSRFGWRRHPIFKDRRFHSGVDYAAPKGTRIYASGDGVVTRAQYAGGYGNMVMIKHNSEYTTGYAHMKGFAKGIRRGVRVKQGQVIGYVGSTGRSTGPHLHFEVVRNGRKVDPLKVKAATGTNLVGKDLKLFKNVIEKIIAKADGITEVASADKVSGDTRSDFVPTAN